MIVGGTFERKDNLTVLLVLAALAARTPPQITIQFLYLKSRLESQFLSNDSAKVMTVKLAKEKLSLVVCNPMVGQNSPKPQKFTPDQDGAPQT